MRAAPAATRILNEAKRRQLQAGPSGAVGKLRHHGVNVFNGASQRHLRVLDLRWTGFQCYLIKCRNNPKYCTTSVAKHIALVEAAFAKVPPERRKAIRDQVNKNRASLLKTLEREDKLKKEAKLMWVFSPERPDPTRRRFRTSFGNFLRYYYFSGRGSKKSFKDLQHKKLVAKHTLRRAQRQVTKALRKAALKAGGGGTPSQPAAASVKKSNTWYEGLLAEWNALPFEAKTEFMLRPKEAERELAKSGNSSMAMFQRFSKTRSKDQDILDIAKTKSWAEAAKVLGAEWRAHTPEERCKYASQSYQASFPLEASKSFW